MKDLRTIKPLNELFRDPVYSPTYSLGKMSQKYDFEKDIEIYELLHIHMN